MIYLTIGPLLMSSNQPTLLSLIIVKFFVEINEIHSTHLALFRTFRQNSYKH